MFRCNMHQIDVFSIQIIVAVDEFTINQDKFEDNISKYLASVDLNQPSKKWLSSVRKIIKTSSGCCSNISNNEGVFLILINENYINQIATFIHELVHCSNLIIEYLGIPFITKNFNGEDEINCYIVDYLFTVFQNMFEPFKSLKEKERIQNEQPNDQKIS